MGRAPECHIYLSNTRISGEHALFRWRDGRWQIQDLDSRNGTFVDGERIDTGKSVGITQGSVLSFGSRARYLLLDDGPPRPHAVALERPYRAVEGEVELLALPHDESPEFTISYRDESWWLESADTLEAITNGHVLVTSADKWRLHLPEMLAPTVDAEDTALSIATIALRFMIDGHGRCVGLAARRGAQSLELKPRTHHAVLLALAQVRLADSNSPARDRGWITQDVLLERLGYDSSRLHVEVYRSRKQFAKAGILDAARLVERRAQDRSLRLGVEGVELVRAQEG